MKSLQIRQKFLDFFARNGHTIVPSSSLIPAQDPTLLFANAGMNQFKDVFLGKEVRSYKRATSIQKCMRAGGKHNDLDNVGFTKRHLTFFEMMGNFSFGDYFKKEAIQFAWDFITQDLKLNKEQLYATVYEKDDESYTIWQTQIGLPANKIIRLGAVDNFWQMGDTGPCGPCSEIYIDRGAAFGCGAHTCAPGCSCDRFLEFWNLVFMQFDRQPDGTDVPLKHPGVDTGMGLERLCAIIQNVDSVFHTDLFTDVIKRTEELTKIMYAEQTPPVQAAFHVLADHIRASCFLIADGCTPSNEGRGYVLRKIIRRAALFAKKLTDKNIFPQLADVIVHQMSQIYPELTINRNAIVNLLNSEIEKFAINLVQGQQILEKYCAQKKDGKIISGQEAFKLYDTYGFPLELTQLIAHEKGFTVDTAGFNSCMEQQREQSGKKDETTEIISLPESITTTFTGYEELETKSSIIALMHHNNSVAHVAAGETCWVITEKSPFYVECGGQISDKGWIIFEGNKSAEILELKKIGGAIAAKIQTPIAVSVGNIVTQRVDKDFRLNTMKNHTATHLLQAALIQVFGKQIKQAGSLVAPDYLRFDFTYHENLTPEEIKKVEDIVNAKILENIPVSIKYTTLKDATNHGVIAFFGEKYNPEHVRVVQVPGFSAELCGGTHVRATGDIGCFKITEITALSAGQRRLMAVTGPKAIELFQQSFNALKSLSQEFKVPLADVQDAIKKQKEQFKNAQILIKKVKKQLIKSLMPHWITRIEIIGTMPFLCIALENFAADELKEIASELTAKKPGLYVLISTDETTSTFFAQLAAEYRDMFNMQTLSTWLKEQGLRSGGKDLMLQGGGTRVEATALEKLLKSWLKENITVQ